MPCSYTEIRHQFFYAHNIFSSVIIFLLDFIGGTKALWYCDILTHICSWFTYFFFVRFHIINLASLSNILFFLLTLFRKERKKNKGKHFLSTQFSSFFICISYRFTCSTYSPHVYIIDFWSAFYEVLSLRFFCRLFFVLKLFFSL